MTTASSSAILIGNSLPIPRGRIIAYWIATGFIALNAAFAGTMDILRIQPFFGVLLHLGYPAYFSAILGMWKVLGALALVAPRYPQTKEWAYAGMFFDFTAAVASYAAMGEASAANVSGPLLSIAFLAASWALRPSSRRAFSVGIAQ